MIEHRKLKGVTGVYPLVSDYFTPNRQGLTIMLRNRSILRENQNNNRAILKYFFGYAMNKQHKEHVLFCPICYEDIFKGKDTHYKFTCINDHTTHQKDLLVGEDYEKAKTKKKV